MAHTLLDVEHAKVFDLIETLGYDIQDIVSLPQLVVCGDQSAGKSSILQGISGIKLPADPGQCTRFPTKVVLARSTTPSINVSIQPSKSCDPELRNELESFKSSSVVADDLRGVIEQAKTVMGLNENSVLSDNVLKIEIAGPECPHLTLVDLPGLIMSTRDSESRHQVKMIEKLVRSYMENDKTIILAVVSAENDFENQRVLEMVKEYDPEGSRTLGIITKPDRRRGRAAQSNVLSYAKNELRHLDLGWHIVRNPDSDTPVGESTSQDVEEATFFSTPPWSTLPKSQLGIPSLIDRLSKRLGVRISEQIPSLITEIEGKLKECESNLEALGEARDSAGAQRDHLSRVAIRFQALVGESLSGHYSDKLLDPGELRLRARIREIQYSLLYNIMYYGPKFDIQCEHSPWDLGRDRLSDVQRNLRNDFPNLPFKYRKPRKISCAEHAREVEDSIIKKNRGPYLPTMFDPSLLGDVFRDLSSNWEIIVREHLELIHQKVDHFVWKIFSHITDEYAHSNLSQEILIPRLDKMKDKLFDKMKEVMAPYGEMQPMSWNPSLFSLLRGASRRELSLKGDEDSVVAADRDGSDKLCHEAYCYYKTAQFTMIDTISSLAVENRLLHDLRELFTPSEISKLDEAALERLGGESSELAEQRSVNQDKKSRLESALAQCRHHMTLLQRRSAAVSGSGRGHQNLPRTAPPFGLGQGFSTPAVENVGLRSRSPGMSVEGKQEGQEEDEKSKDEDEHKEEEGPPPLTPNRSPSSSPPHVATPRYAGLFPPSTLASRRKNARQRVRSRVSIDGVEDEEEEL